MWDVANILVHSLPGCLAPPHCRIKMRDSHQGRRSPRNSALSTSHDIQLFRLPYWRVGIDTVYHGSRDQQARRGVWEGLKTARNGSQRLGRRAVCVLTFRHKGDPNTLCMFHPRFHSRPNQTADYLTPEQASSLALRSLRPTRLRACAPK